MSNSAGAFWQQLPNQVILFGGTFDPVQAAHCEMVRRALSRFDAKTSAVVFIPAGRNPLKSSDPVASNEDRAAMIEAAIKEDLVSLPCWVSTIEFSRSGASPSYTVDTVREIRAQLRREQKLHLLMGGDSACSFQRWKEPESILNTIDGMLVVLRAESDREEIVRVRESFAPAVRSKFASEILDGTLMAVSASDIRTRLARQESVTGLLPRQVAHYIHAKGLYRPPR